MLDFQPLAIDKIPIYKQYYDDTNAVGLEYSFVSGYLWSREYLLRIAFYDDTLIKAYFRDDNKIWGYCLPSGKNVRGAIEACLRDADDRGQEPMFGYLSKSEKEKLEELYPSRFVFERSCDTQDYIYLSHDLAELEGKHFHAKRNHISRFYREYPDASVAELNDRNRNDALRVMELWCAENDIDPKSHGEYAVICEALENFQKLGMRGMVLYALGEPVAMTMGSEISRLCFDVCFEKALRGYPGSYAVINNEFAKTLTAYQYINREEDLGLEGLRKAKLSYSPVIIYDRFEATLK
ncbi:MAG: DUF2156 domain-containing protein [Ruminococcus sp.]|nr:DUF2156 domain-containing protein [Ruminococcus sp.]